MPVMSPAELPGNSSPRCSRATARSTSSSPTSPWATPGTGFPVTYSYRGISNGDTVAFTGSVSFVQPLDGSSVTGSTPPFPAIHVNATQAGLLGVSPNFLRQPRSRSR